MANHTAQHIAATGGTYYAYPAYSATYTLANWGTHRVELAELASPNEGMYQGTIDDAKGFVWSVFSGASQPASWDEAVASLDFNSELDVDGYTLEEAMRIALAALAGKVTGGGTTTNVFRAADDSKTRITATVDSDGNRSAITLDET